MPLVVFVRRICDRFGDPPKARNPLFRSFFANPVEHRDLNMFWPIPRWSFESKCMLPRKSNKCRDQLWADTVGSHSLRMVTSSSAGAITVVSLLVVFSPGRRFEFQCLTRPRLGEARRRNQASAAQAPSARFQIFWDCSCKQPSCKPGLGPDRCHDLLSLVYYMFSCSSSPHRHRYPDRPRHRHCRPHLYSHPHPPLPPTTPPPPHHHRFASSSSSPLPPRRRRCHCPRHHHHRHHHH